VPAPERLPALSDLDEVLTLLREGDLEVEGRLVDASNVTLLCRVTLDGVSAECVHKPVAGERPLWDFPDGTLSAREVAAYEVSQATGWAIVPPTVMRNGPLGPGMCQLWIDVDETVDLVSLVRSDDARLRRISVFDAVVNNADRKGGHLLPTVDGHLYGVDHGVCFSTEDKLRTVLWGWRGQPLTEEAREVLIRLRAALSGKLGDELAGLLDSRELLATVGRVEQLLAEGVHPLPSEDWPAVPWPPF
jgi:uncharacterized repeat protein (TIGR03843 family)